MTEKIKGNRRKMSIGTKGPWINILKELLILVMTTLK